MPICFCRSSKLICHEIYRKKTVSEPQCLTEYKEECAENNVPQPYLYKDFNRTSELRHILVTEQHDVFVIANVTAKLIVLSIPTLRTGRIPLKVQGCNWNIPICLSVA